jgi:hypothetical protein
MAVLGILGASLVLWITPLPAQTPVPAQTHTTTTTTTVKKKKTHPLNHGKVVSASRHRRNAARKAARKYSGKHRTTTVKIIQAK